MSRVVRRIPPDDMLLMLNSIKFGDKNQDMILAYISIMDDLLLELIINPKNF